MKQKFPISKKLAKLMYKKLTFGFRFKPHIYSVKPNLRQKRKVSELLWCGVRLFSKKKREKEAEKKSEKGRRGGDRQVNI